MIAEAAESARPTLIFAANTRQDRMNGRRSKEARVKLTDLFVAELDREGPLTRRALEAVPEGRDDWKPHAKSMPLGRLAGLVAMMPSWVTMIVEQDETDLKPKPGAASPYQREFKTRKALVQAMEEGVAGARKALEATSDE